MSAAFSYGDRGDLCPPHVLVSDPGVVHQCCVVLAGVVCPQFFCNLCF